MVFTKDATRASLHHDLATAVPQAPTREIEAAATAALASIPSDVSLSLREVEHIVAKAVRDLKSAPISFGTPKPNVVTETTTKALGGDNRRTFRITRAT